MERELSELSRVWRTVDEVIDRTCSVPERLTITEWADKYRRLADPSNTTGVKYKSSVTPYVRKPQDLLDDPDVPMVVLAWPSQSAKSTVMENAIGYRMHMKPSHQILVRPKIEDAEGWSRERFDTMVSSTPALSEAMRPNDSLMRYKVYLGGSLFIAAAASATELASRSAPYLYVDEVDRMEILQGEGSPIEIAKRRQAAMNVGCILLTSTPRHANTTLIMPYLEDGTFEKYEVPCPHCGVMQPLLFGAKEKKKGLDGGLRWPKHEPRKAVYMCAACSKAIDEHDKREMLRQGDWVPTRPNADYPSFHLNALYSPFAKSNWGSIASEWDKAKGKPYDLQVFVNTRLAETWEEESSQIDVAALGDRYEEWEEGKVPNGVGVLTAGVDVQDGWLELHVWGWGEDLESWLVHFEQIVGDTNVEPHVPDSVWKELDKALMKPFDHVNGKQVRIMSCMVDSGFRTGIVYKFTKPRLGRRIFASKGVGGKGVPLLGKATMQGHARTVLFPLGVDTMKEEFLRSQIHVADYGPGYVHIPKWTNDDWRAQLVAEKRVTKTNKMRNLTEEVWMPKSAGSRTEALDCRIMARAALERLGISYISNLGKMADDLSGVERKEDAEVPNDTATDEDEIIQRPVIRGQERRSSIPQGESWVSGWWNRG